MRRPASQCSHRVCDSEATASSRETLIPHSVRGHGLVPVCTEQEGTVCLARGYTLAFFWCCQQGDSAKQTPSRTESRREEENGRRDLVQPRPNQAVHSGPANRPIQRLPSPSASPTDKRHLDEPGSTAQPSPPGISQKEIYSSLVQRCSPICRYEQPPPPGQPTAWCPFPFQKKKSSYSPIPKRSRRQTGTGGNKISSHKPRCPNRLLCPLCPLKPC